MHHQTYKVQETYDIKDRFNTHLHMFKLENQARHLCRASNDHHQPSVCVAKAKRGRFLVVHTEHKDNEKRLTLKQSSFPFPFVMYDIYND